MRKKCDGSICVFLALVLFLIVSLILVLLESAIRSASQSYAQILLKTAAESVMGEYCGPLFADYHILALDSGFGNTAGDMDELEVKLKSYLDDENVWNFKNENVAVTDVRKLMDEWGESYFDQIVSYEKYATPQDILNEVLGRIKSIGNQNEITKVMERKAGVEDELSVIDKYTMDLMRLIDGINLNMGSKAASVLGYSVGENFVKKFFVGGITVSASGINNPSVYEKIQEKCIDPLIIMDEYIKALSENEATLKEIQDDLEKYEEAQKLEKEYSDRIDQTEKDIGALEDEIKMGEELIKECEEKIKEADSIEDKDEAGQQKETYTNLKTSTEEANILKQSEKEIKEKDIESFKELKKQKKAEKDKLEKSVAAARKVLTGQVKIINEKADQIYRLIDTTKTLLKQVAEIVDKAGEQQKKVRPLVEEYDKTLKSLSGVIDEDTGESLKENLDFMKAYVGMGNGIMKTTDFYSVKLTATYDISVLDLVDMQAFAKVDKDVLEEITARLEKAKNAKESIKGFSYNGFSFDYSEIKENVIENKLMAEFESNVADGYLKLFLEGDTILSENKMIGELLPSLWFEVAQEQEEDPGRLTEDAGSKGSGANLGSMNDSSGISDLVSLLAGGIEEVGRKLMSAMYMLHHFKTFGNRSVTGDTVLDYEVEYVLSGFETDKANLSAAITKIMFLRLPICVIYTMTNRHTRAAAQAFAVSVIGFTGLPFLVAIVKYLVLFLWAAAQAVIETAAIVRGKKVPVLTGDDSFCLSLAELPAFAGLVSEKADKFKESPVYLDYDNYLLILLLLKDRKTETARAMDVIQENIRYKYDEDFLMSNAITAFSCTASFTAPSKYASFLSGFGSIGNTYGVKVRDSVAY